MTQLSDWSPASLAAQKKHFRIHLLVFVLATPVSWLVWYLTWTGLPWPLWSTAGWTIGIVFHYLAVFVFKHKKATIE